MRSYINYNNFFQCGNAFRTFLFHQHGPGWSTAPNYRHLRPSDVSEVLEAASDEQVGARKPAGKTRKNVCVRPRGPLGASIGCPGAVEFTNIIGGARHHATSTALRGASYFCR